MAKAGRALANAEAACFAEIVPPGIGAVRLVGLVTRSPPAERLRMREGRRFQRKADLRISCQVGVARLPGVTASCEDIAGSAIGEIARRLQRAFRNSGRDVRVWPRRQTARDAERLQK